MSMILAIEGLVPNPHPDRRLTSSQKQSTASPVHAQRSHQPAEGTQPCDAVTPAEAQPVTPHNPAPEPPPKPTNSAPFPHFESRLSHFNPFVHNPNPDPVPAATGLIFDAVLTPALPCSLSLPPKKTPSNAAAK